MDDANFFKKSLPYRNIWRTEMQHCALDSRKIEDCKRRKSVTVPRNLRINLLANEVARHLSNLTAKGC